MTVLRSRTILSKTLKLENPSPSMAPSAPIKSQEPPTPLPSAPSSSPSPLDRSPSRDSAAAAAPATACSPPVPVFRRSLRIASRSPPAALDAPPSSDSRNAPKKRKARNSVATHLPCEGGGEVAVGSDDADSGIAEGGSGQKAWKSRVLSSSCRKSELFDALALDGLGNAEESNGGSAAGILNAETKKDDGFDLVKVERSKAVERRVSEMDGRCSVREVWAVQVGLEEISPKEVRWDVEGGDKDVEMMSVGSLGEAESGVAPICVRRSGRLAENHKLGMSVDLNSAAVDGNGSKDSDEAEFGNGNIALEDIETNHTAWADRLRRKREDAVNLTLSLDSLTRDGGHGGKRYIKEEKGKGLMIEENWLSIGGVAKKPTAEGPQIDNFWQVARAGKKLSKEEKGKGQLVEENLWPDKNDKLNVLLLAMAAVEREIPGPLAINEMSKSNGVKERGRRPERKRDAVERNRERFLSTARHYASQYAHFDAEREEEAMLVPETAAPVANADEDWPGPFSTAIRIIQERAEKLGARRGTSILQPSKIAPVIEWFPSQDRNVKLHGKPVPSLQDICFTVLCKHAEAITSLEGIPDAIRSRLVHSLCDLRKMDHHILSRVISGSPSEIRIKDCSWLAEEQFLEIFGTCDTECMKVLQLDQCGRCVADYTLRDTLARPPNRLSLLNTLSLRGAYRLSDNGLNSLVSFTPSLRSLNLAECSLLTSKGINILAETLAPVLKELYIDGCQNIDAMSALPALKKLKYLEVLSVAGIQSVCDKFVSQLMPICGSSIKELNFSGCEKLTDVSVKAVAEHCSGLCAINLANLKNLTDISLRHVANGCQSLKILKFCRNMLSDEGVAAFLEASGESLTELSLNNVKEVANNTAIALSTRCSKTLSSLDLSFCRKLMDEALGLIVDKCMSLRLLKLFGCTQVTTKFLDGHSNPHVNVVGLKATPVLEHLHTQDSLQMAIYY